MIGCKFRGSCMKKVVVLVGRDTGCKGRMWLIDISVDAQRDGSLHPAIHIHFVKSAQFCSWMSIIPSTPNRLGNVNRFYGTKQCSPEKLIFDPS
jgi:hypothetical protein